MINKIIDSICLVLSENFKDFEIYTNKVEQGLKVPCFFVYCINQTMDLFLNTKYKNENFITIQYLTDREIDYSISEKLFDILEYIVVDGDILRGSKMKSEKSDDLITFTIHFDLFLRKGLKANDFMERYKVVSSGKI